MNTRSAIETIIKQYGEAICQRPRTALAEAMTAIDALGLVRLEYTGKGASADYSVEESEL